MPDALTKIEDLADILWDGLAEIGVVDSRGGVEYDRRIVALRAWLWDEDGQPPEGES